MSARRPLRVCLVSMPWREPNGANPGAGLLKATLIQAGHHVDVFDANVLFRVRLGEIYHHISDRWFSEMAFAPALHRDHSLEYCGQIIAACVKRGSGSDELTRVSLDEAAELPRRCAAILDEAYDRFAWQDYDVVGFSATFNQTLASAALARRIRAEHPGVKLIIGGAACEGPMGRAMMEAFDCYDAAAVGRAETTVVGMCERVAAGASLADLAGVIGRRDGALEDCGRPAARANLDALPLPNYDDYFALVKELGYKSGPSVVFVETSLGCWWGEKNLCTFCGLNATSLAFSQKSPERALREIRELSSRYAVDHIHFTDNILPLDYYETLIPELVRLREEEDEHYSFFVEVKTNVKREQLQLLHRAGFVNMQPGIESFSDHVLRLMKKGNTGISQVQFVKWCTEMGISVFYNIIVRNPGERAEDYVEMCELVPSLVHLVPPDYVCTMSLQRFSPYFDHPDAYGIRNVQPMKQNEMLYPGLPAELVGRLSYEFCYQHDEIDAESLRQARAELCELMEHWRSVHRPGLLTLYGDADALVIDDRRPGVWLGTDERRSFRLHGLQARIYRFLDQARTPEQVARAFGVDEHAVMGVIETLGAQRLLHFDGAKALALAIPVSRARAGARDACAAAPPQL